MRFWREERTVLKITYLYTCLHFLHRHYLQVNYTEDCSMTNDDDTPMENIHSCAIVNCFASVEIHGPFQVGGERSNFDLKVRRQARL